MYSRILVPMDGSKASERALNEAIRIAGGGRAQIRVVHVLDASTAYSYPVTHRTELREEGLRMLEGVRLKLQQAVVPCEVQLVETDNIHETIAECLNRYAQSHQTDLVVMGTTGRRGWRRMAFGSVAEGLARIACCPVLLMHEEPSSGSK
jgi:nucleotide-binding universal stress UspA family protein